MEELNTRYVKRNQKDYSISFKLSVVTEIEHGEIRKYTKNKLSSPTDEAVMEKNHIKKVGNTFTSTPYQHINTDIKNL